MTEEIIEVNGLNVTKCTHLSDCLLCDYTENHSQFCSDYDNCYYKQLKRLQTENEALHERLRTIIYNATGGRLSYSTYTVQAVEQAFYDQLEILTEQRTKDLEEENEEMKNENIELQEKFLDLNGKSYSYRKTLEEIREMVNKPCVPSENDCLTCPTSCFTKDILIKINEVLK